MLVLLAIEAGAVKEGSCHQRGFVPSRRVLSSRMPSRRVPPRRVPSRWVRDLAIKAGVVEVDSGSC